MNVMSNNEYDEDVLKGLALLGICREYIKDHKISSGESVWQRDDILLTTADFLVRCCDVVGWYDYLDEE